MDSERILTSLLVGFMFLIGVTAEAQDKYLEGVVTDRSTGAFLPDMTVEIHSLGLSTTTDADGNYAFWHNWTGRPWEKGQGVIPPGIYYVQAFGDDYLPRGGWLDFMVAEPGVTMEFQLCSLNDAMMSGSVIPVGSQGIFDSFVPYAQGGKGWYLNIPVGVVPGDRVCSGLPVIE